VRLVGIETTSDLLHAIVGSCAAAPDEPDARSDTPAPEPSVHAVPGG
jgi:hypothetical protein